MCWTMQWVEVQAEAVVYQCISVVYHTTTGLPGSVKHHFTWLDGMRF